MSGEGDDYTADEVDELYDELYDAFAEYAGRHGEGGQVNAVMTVTARVEWAGEYSNNNRNGERTVKLDRLNLTAVRDAVNKAAKLEGLAMRGPLRSYKAKGWEAQLKQLQGTKRGQEALREAGFNPSRETLRRYGRGEQAPGKPNRAKIADAYDAARNPGRGWAEAKREAANALTETLRQHYGGYPVRFRDITEMGLD